MNSKRVLLKIFSPAALVCVLLFLSMTGITSGYTESDLLSDSRKMADKTDGIVSGGDGTVHVDTYRYWWGQLKPTPGSLANFTDDQLITASKAYKKKLTDKSENKRESARLAYLEFLKSQKVIDGGG
ncbi:MAG: hypothetical protein F4166_08255 [Gammaproteobacteria bacterium]|nr:hypothetical protein [Gammaproteobacteria bacterium]MXX95261.1 hypothetical protein [Gammaproteobacteria bacterium]MYF53784.1 hypothetical protein [Gammaproteobacteria bacterium]